MSPKVQSFTIRDSESGFLIQGSLFRVQLTISLTILPDTEIKIAKTIVIILCNEKKEKFLIPFLYMMKIKPLLICGNRLTLIYLMNLSNYQKNIVMNSSFMKKDILILNRYGTSWQSTAKILENAHNGGNEHDSSKLAPDTPPLNLKTNLLVL